MPKYLIKARIEVDGIVEKPDVIGAIFGQTEGLFGPQLDLRELQDKGRIGRIQVDLKVQGSRTVGEITIPSNLDRIETALVAAMIETVDRVGPYTAKIKISDIIDLRLEKIKRIVERAKEILKKWSLEKSPDIKEILSEIAESLRTMEITKYGPEELPAGPDIDKANTIIIVEGRADVINLLRYGYGNVIALEGARSKIPDTIVELCRKKKCIAFADGDHGGELILKELLRSVDIDEVARAPPGKEVEELTGKEISRALRNAVPASQYRALIEKEKKEKPPKKPEVEEKVKPPQQPQVPVAQPRITEEVEEKTLREEVKGLEEYVISFPDTVLDTMRKLQGTLEAVMYDENWNPVKKVPVRDLYDELARMDAGKVFAVVFDGIITQRLVDIASDKRVKILVGARIGGISKRPHNVEMLTFNDLL